MSTDIKETNGKESSDFSDVTPNDWKNLGHIFLDFFAENEMIKYLALIMGSAGIIYIFVNFLNLRVLTIFSYTIGIILLAFIIYYSYKDYEKKRDKLAELEEAYENSIDSLLEDEDFQEELLETKQGFNFFRKR